MLQKFRSFLARPIASNSLWLMADRVGRMLVNFFVMVWIARHLGPEGYGHLQLAISLVAVMAFTSVLGLDQIAVREFSTRPEDQGRLLGTLVCLRLAGGIIGYSTLMAVLLLGRPYELETLQITAILGIGLLFQAADSIDWWFLSRTQSRHSVIMRTIAFACSTGWRIAAVLSGAGVMTIAIATLIELIIAAPLLALAFQRHRSTGQPLRFDKTIAVSLLRQGAPLLINAIAVIIYMKSDQLLVGHFLGAHGAGQYAAAARLSEVWYMVPNTIVASAAASLAQLRLTSDAGYARAMSKLFRFLTLASVGLAIPIALGADLIIGLLYGAAYAPAADVLRLHIFTAIFVFAGVAQGQWLINERLATLMLPRMIGAAITTVSLNLLLLPRLGLIGAPLALLGGQLVAVVIFPLLTPRMRPLLKLQWQALWPSPGRDGSGNR